MAIQDQIGVCESYVAIYNRMCNLTGVPTYGQIGETQDADGVRSDTRHIWSVQLDEAGNVFYTDPTWADNGFAGKGITMKQFMTYCMNIAKSEAGFSGFFMMYGLDEQYFWQEALWDSHIPVADFAQIQASYQQNTAQAG